jgi:polysaccharide pyruvyl transferase WcaK-like protein
MSRISQTLRALRRSPSLPPAPPPARAARVPDPLRRAVGPRAPTLLLLNDCRDQISYGCEVLVEGLIHILTAAIPDHTLRHIPSHWLMESDYYSEFYDGSSLVPPVAVWPQVADEFEFIADEWLAGRGGQGADIYLKTLNGVDVVVLNGEGSMYQKNTTAIRELFIAWFAKARLGIPTVFLNGLVQLTAVVPILPAMMRKTFRVLDAVAVRDPYSLRNLQEFLPEVPATIIPDSARAPPIEIDSPSPGVRTLFKELGTADFFCFDPGPMPMDYRFGTRSAAHRLVKEMKQLVPQAVMVASVPGAATMLRTLAADTDSIYLEHQPSYTDLTAVLARAKFQISGRIHDAVLGARVGCPLIAIGSTSHKVHGVCELLGFNAPYDGTDLCSSFDRIKTEAASHLAGGARLRSEISSNAARLSAESFEMGTLVKDVLAKHGKSTA